MAMGRQKALSASAFDCVLSIPQKRVVLRELEKRYNTALACQILGVKAIPVELEELVTIRFIKITRLLSNQKLKGFAVVSLLQRFKMTGNPGWLESYLMSLLQAEGLQLTYLTRRQIEEIKLVTVQEEVTTKNVDPDIRHPNATAGKDLLDRSESLKVSASIREVTHMY